MLHALQGIFFVSEQNIGLRQHTKPAATRQSASLIRSLSYIRALKLRVRLFALGCTTSPVSSSLPCVVRTRKRLKPTQKLGNESSIARKCFASHSNEHWSLIDKSFCEARKCFALYSRSTLALIRCRCALRLVWKIGGDPRVPRNLLDGISV